MKKKEKQNINDLDIILFVIFPAHIFLTIRLLYVDDDHDQQIHYDHQSYI
jgi:hypothetical protein